jgi:hypothetical protein
MEPLWHFIWDTEIPLTSISLLGTRLTCRNWKARFHSWQAPKQFNARKHFERDCGAGRSGQGLLFEVPKLPQLEPAHVVEENNLKVASLLDLAGTKASVIQVRAEAKDYLDLDALMRLGGVDLATALSAAHALYGQTFNPEVNQRRAGRAAWQEFRKHESPVPDLEEVRRRAREDWRKNILTENEWSG